MTEPVLYKVKMHIPGVGCVYEHVHGVDPQHAMEEAEYMIVGRTGLLTDDEIDSAVALWARPWPCTDTDD